MRKQKKYLFFFLFLEVVTLTFVLQTSIWMDNAFDLQTSISIGLPRSPSGMCVPSFIYIRHFVLKISCRNKKKHIIFVLFSEVVTFTFVLQTSISTGFLLSPSGMCVPSFIYIRHFVLKISCRNKKKHLILVLFFKVVTLTIDLQTSISIGFLLSPSGMCVPSFI